MPVNLEKVIPEIAEGIKEMCDFDENTLKNLSIEEAFDLWLRWEGIVEYTDRIIEVLDNLRSAYEVK